MECIDLEEGERRREGEIKCVCVGEGGRGGEIETRKDMEHKHCNDLT